MTDLSSSVAAPALFALLCWWFGTGAILWLVRRPSASFRTSLVWCTGLLALSLWTIQLSMQAQTVGNAYLGFVSVIAMWAWHEVAFLTGWLTGPRRVPLDPGARGWQRFTQSTQVVIWHELALLLNFAVLLWMQQGQPSHVALCTFAILWCMRFSAKLNLFFGVPQVGEQYLPRHLAYLGSYFKKGRLSAFFYLSVAASCTVWAWIVWELVSGRVTASTGGILLASLLGLAIVEHLIMAFPTPMQKLWGWAMSRSPSSDRPQVSAAMPPAPVPIQPDKAPVA
ncbi:MAG: putative photosynthetic complex assembly protein PuhE [Hydrogenophaga sp.]|jgi:putative photosynthetic complex assembly protein 2|nr:putative photosynthetic complex assembly protein PuhE [Hydrogenophaga sp.]